ncbi:MAG: hypothetical protein A2005_06310 [Desulfuromonadales bacterium GWC2_61_20]|nr:MAG: hypothetical protein A2005_06310 [Desulfuromonadales bacterium GWC2_61_20]HAD04433.1 hypothetical protein [Desulfuromonas sp.]
MFPMKNNRPVVILMCVAVLSLFFSGCAGQKAFMEGEKLTRQGKLDEAVVSFAEAVQKNPEKQEYRQKLIQTRNSAATKHLESGREFLAAGKRVEALSDLRMASAYAPSLEVAAQEAKIIENQLRADELVTEAESFYRARRIAQAKNTIDAVFNLEPENAAAKALLGKINAGGKTVMDGVELDVNSAQPINLKFKATGIKDVFNILSKLSGINFILDEEIKTQTNVTLLLENATFPQALELILQLNKLGKKVLNSRTIIVYPRTKEKDKQFADQLIQTFYLSNIDAKKAVNLLRTMLQLRKIYVHEELNALIVRDTPDVIKLCAQILESADRADSEVLFELELIDVAKSDDLEIGTQLAAKRYAFGLVDSGATGILSSFVADSVKDLEFMFTVPTATFDLKKSLTDTDLLASPKIRVKNKEKAKVVVGSKEPVVTVTTTGGGGVSGTTQDNIQYVDVGIKLNIEPTIQLDNSVFVKVGLEVSSADDLGKTDSGSILLRINTTNAETALTLKDGERTIIGGLMRNDTTNNKETIPFIGDIPLIGPMLSYYKKGKGKREILLSITPHIVKNVVIPSQAETTIWSGGEEDLKAGPAFGTFAGSFDPETSRLPEKAVPAKQVVSPVKAAAATGILENVGAEQAAVSVNADEIPVSPEGLAAAVVLPPSVVPAETPEPAADGLPPTAPEAAAPTLPAPAPAAAPLVQLQPFPVPPVGDGKLALVGATEVKVGEEAILEVTIADGNKLYSAPLFVFFDQAALDFVRAEEGDFLRQGGQPTVFTTSALAGQGQLIVGYKQGVGATGVSGSGTLFRLIFKGKAPGAASVRLDRINFRDQAGQRLKVEAAATTLEVR